MNKINGYTEDEAKKFVKFMSDGMNSGKTLTALFEQYAKKSGRAKGSVRNYYYALLRSTGDERVKKLLRGTRLKAEHICGFTEEETDEILRGILQQKSRGVSVRKAVLNLADGDDRLMLRYQNKYRNVLNKQPERIEKIMREYEPAKAQDRKKLEDEINGLYDRLALSLKEENKRLSDTCRRLSDENAVLRQQIKNLQG